jgi:hypothetical protein
MSMTANVPEKEHIVDDKRLRITVVGILKNSSAVDKIA